MRLISRRGQSTGEYAILFAIVLGAVVAMQNYIRNRITGTIRAGADNFLVQAAVAVPGAAPFAPNQQTTSSSDTWLDLDKAGAGEAGAGSGSRSFRTNQ